MERQERGGGGGIIRACLPTSRYSLAVVSFSLFSCVSKRLVAIAAYSLKMAALPSTRNPPDSCPRARAFATW